MVVNKVVHLAEAAWHHPDLTLSFTLCDRQTNHAFGKRHYRERLCPSW